MAAPIIKIKRSAVPGKKPTANNLPLGELGLNTYDAELFVRRERVGIGTDIVSVGIGASVTNILYVTEDGNDTNTGRKLGDAKRTIGAALTTAKTGTAVCISESVADSSQTMEPPTQRPQRSLVRATILASHSWPIKFAAHPMSWWPAS